MTGSELRLARKTAGLSQAHLAQRIGRGVRTVNRWERDGDSPIPHVVVAVVAAVLRGDRSVALPPMRTSDALAEAAELAEANGSAVLARHLRRLAANHLALGGDDDPVNPPVATRHDA